MKLVSNAKSAWRWFSVQAMVLQGAVAVTWASLPDDMRAQVPSEWILYATVALMVLGVIGRLVDQGGGA